MYRHDLPKCTHLRTNCRSARAFVFPCFSRLDMFRPWTSMNDFCFSKRFDCYPILWTLEKPWESLSDRWPLWRERCRRRSVLASRDAKATGAKGVWVTKSGFQLYLLQNGNHWILPETCCSETFSNINLSQSSAFICIHHENLDDIRSIIRALSIEKVNQHGREEGT